MAQLVLMGVLNSEFDLSDPYVKNFVNDYDIYKPAIDDDLFATLLPAGAIEGGNGGGGDGSMAQRLDFRISETQFTAQRWFKHDKVTRGQVSDKWFSEIAFPTNMRAQFCLVFKDRREYTMHMERFGPFYKRYFTYVTTMLVTAQKIPPSLPANRQVAAQKPSADVIEKAANTTGAISNEVKVESCVLVGKNWVLGSSHYPKTLSDITTRHLSFDLIPTNPDRNSDKYFSFDLVLDKGVEKWQIQGNYQVGLFKINKNIAGSYPALSPPKGFYKFSDGDNVFIVGHPSGVWFRQVLQGKISKIGKNNINAVITLNSTPVGFSDFQGFSGGPVFSAAGQLIGIMIEKSGHNEIRFTRLDAIYNAFDAVGFPINSEAPALKG
nr:serine protease [uncultured Albidiferax sp.]